MERPRFIETENGILIMWYSTVGDKLVTAAIAFSLALFSHVLNHVVIRLQSALYELENPRKVLQVDSAGSYIGLRITHAAVLSNDPFVLALL